MEAVYKVRNPHTGRLITVGGQVYNNLIAQGYRLVQGQLVQEVIPLPTPPQPVRPLPTPPQPVRPLPTPPQPVTVPILPQTVPIGNVPAPPQTVPIGSIPAPPQLISQELAQIIQEEQRTCKLCQQYYINRYTKFTPPELNNLRIIQQLCGRCANLCGQRYARAGLPPGPDCAPYDHASRHSQQQAAALDSQIRTQAIRVGSAAGTNVNRFFPSIPQ